VIHRKSKVRIIVLLGRTNLNRYLPIRAAEERSSHRLDGYSVGFQATNDVMSSSPTRIYRRANLPAKGEKLFDYHGIHSQGQNFFGHVGVVGRTMKKRKRTIRGPCRPTQQLAAKDTDR